MKKIISNIILSSVIIAIAYIFSTIKPYKHNIIGIDDGLRHLQYTNILDKYGYDLTYKNFTQGDIIQNSILSDYKTDLWEGYHLLLLGIKKLGVQDINILKFYTSICFGLILFILLSIGDRLKLPKIIPIGFFIILLMNEFIFRLFLARPFTISVLLYIILLITLTEKNFKYIIPIWIIGVYFHSIFYLLIIPIFFYVIFFKPGVKLTLRIIVYCLFGILIGLLIHKGTIDYMILSFYHTILTPLAQLKEGFGSAEAGGADISTLFSITFLLPFVLSIALFFVGYSKINGKIFSYDQKMNFFFMNTFFLLIGIGIYGRFMDYFIILSFVLSLYIIKNIIEIGQIESTNLDKIKYKITAIIFLLFVCAGMVSMHYGKYSINIKKQTKFLTQNKDKILSGSNIMTFKHLQFPIAFYALGENYKYSTSMEPIFFYFKDKRKFLEYKDIFFSYLLRPKYNFSGDFYSAAKSYNADYLINFGNIKEDPYVVEELLKTKIEIIKNDPRFKLIAQDGENYIWKIE